MAHKQAKKQNPISDEMEARINSASTSELEAIMAEAGHRYETAKDLSHWSQVSGPFMRSGCALTWTDKRPTEAGEYWLAVHPDQRGLCLHEGVYKVEVREANHVYHHRGMTRFSDERLGGALWAPRETPADPFEEVTT